MQRQGLRKQSTKTKGSKIQDAKVFAFKNNKGRFAKGIYRQVATKKGTYLSPLFIYKPIPTQRPKQRFMSLVGDIGDKLIFEMWLKEIKELAK